MATALAHELNQPLGAAVNYLHVGQADLERAGLGGKNASLAIDLATVQLFRAGEIVRRIGELLARETCSRGVERVASIVAELSGILAKMERAGGVAIEVLVDDRDDLVQAERIEVQQALLNLVHNAVEALVGRVDPRVRVIGHAVSDECFELRIEHNGQGVAPEEMYGACQFLLSSKGKSLDLRLSVARTIVENHGSSLRIQTKPSGCTAISFCLKRERASERP